MSEPTNYVDQTQTPTDIPGSGTMLDVDQSQTPATGTPATTGAPDAAAAQPTAQTPPQTPEQTAQQFPFPNGAQQQAQAAGGQGQPGTPQGAISQADNPDNPANHPAVKAGGWINATARALAGGDQYSVKIDPNTGTMTRTPVPLSSKQIAMGIAVAALTGAASGLGEKGPGAEGRAAQAGFQQALAQKQNQQAQQDREAQQTYTRQAAIAQTNFQMHQTAVRLGQLDYEQHKQYVADNAKALENVNTVGAALAGGVREQDLLSKYNVTAQNAIPDGIVARLNADGTQATDKYGTPMWDNTYTVIDPAKKIGLDQGTADFLAQHHVPGTFDIVNGKAVAKNFEGSPQVRAGIVVSMLSQASAIRTTEAQLNQQISGLPGGDKNAEVVKANLTDALDHNLISTKSLQAFAPYASMPFDQALDAMRKNKVDPQAIGQIAQLVPQKVQEQLKNQRLEAESAEKAKNDAAAAVTKQNAELPGKIEEARLREQIQTSGSYAQGFNHEAGTQAAKVAAGVASGTLTGKLKNGDLDKVAVDPSEKPIDGVNKGYLANLAAVDPGIAAAVDAVGHGKAFVSNYGLAKDAGQKFLGFVHNAFPGFGVANANLYEKQLNDFGINGKTGKANTAGSTLMEHLLRLNNSVGIGSTTGLSGEFGVNAANATNEAGTFYSNGNKPGEAELKDYRDEFRSHNPLIVKSAAKAQAEAAMDKIKENYNTQARAVPESFGKPQPILSQDAADAYKTLTGKTAPDYLVDHTIQSRAYANDQSQGTNNTSQAARSNGSGGAASAVPRKNPDLPGATTVKKGSDGNYYQFNAQGGYLGPA